MKNAIGVARAVQQPSLPHNQTAAAGKVIEPLITPEALPGSPLCVKDIDATDLMQSAFEWSKS